MAEKLFDAQVNYGWGLSLNMTGKAPAVAKRIFNTYADAKGYADDVNDSAIEGLVLTVVADPTPSNNGVYFVQQIGTKAIEADEEKGIEEVPAKEAVLVKLSSTVDNETSAEAVLQSLNQYISSNDAAVSGLSDSITVLNGDAEVEGSVENKIANAISGLDSEANGEGSHVSVKVTAVDGKISTVEVVENFDFGTFE